MAVTGIGSAALLAGGSVLGSLLGGLFGSSSSSKANETNLQAARETNQMNRDLFEQSLAWQEEMWNKNNKYNSPAETTKRLQAAGINPLLGSEFGQASMPSVPSAPQMQPGHVQPVDYSWIGDTVSNGVNAFFNNQILSNQIAKGAADAQIAKTDAEFQNQSLKYRLMEVMNSAYKSKWEKEQAKIAYNVLNKTQQESIMQSQWNTKIMQKTYEEAIEKIALNKLQQKAMEISNQYAPLLSEAQLKQYHASVVNLYAAARNQDAQALESGARKILVDLQQQGVRLSNQQQDSIMDALIDEAWNNADEAYWNAQDAAKTFRLGKLKDVPANSLTDGGKSYTNYNTHSRNRTKGRIYRDKNGNRIYNYLQ